MNLIFDFFLRGRFFCLYCFRGKGFFPLGDSNFSGGQYLDGKICIVFWWWWWWGSARRFKIFLFLFRGSELSLRFSWGFNLIEGANFSSHRTLREVFIKSEFSIYYFSAGSIFCFPFF